MFDNVNIKHDEKKDIYTISGHYGMRFRRVLERRVLNGKRLNQVFITYGPFGISFYGFFALEVKHILLATINMPSPGVNVRLIEKTIKVIEENTWLLDLYSEFPDTFDYTIIKNKMKFDILDHQKTWFKDYTSLKRKLHYRGRLLAADAGSGKTFMSLATIELVGANKVIIFSPLPAVEKVWVSSIRDTIYKEEQSYFVFNNKTKNKYNGERFIICNYESMTALANLIPEIKGKDTAIIVDESHNMNELNSKRTNLLLQICNAVDSDNILLLSGTPIKARPLEMLPMIEMLDKRFNSTIKKRFIKLYKSMPGVLQNSIKERYGAYRTRIKKESLKLKPVITKDLPIRLKNAKEYTLDKIREKMKVYITNRKAEILNDWDMYKNTYYTLCEEAKEKQVANGVSRKLFDEYEKNIRIIIKVYDRGGLMDIPDIIKFCNKFENEYIRPVLDPEDKKRFNEAKTIVKYLNLKLQGEVLGNVVGRERINCHIDLAKEIDYKAIVNSTIKKTLIFSNYIDVCKKVYEMTDKLGYRPLRVYGEYTKDLSSTVGLFMTPGNELNPLAATYKSLSTAVPLIVANVMLCIDLPFRTHILEQAISRLHRLGQDSEVIVYQVQLDTGDIPNINSRNIDIIAWSAEMVAMITGDEIMTSVIKNEGTEDGAMTVDGISFINSFTATMENITLEEEKEKTKMNIYDAW